MFKISDMFKYKLNQISNGGFKICGQVLSINYTKKKPSFLDQKVKHLIVNMNTFTH